MQYLIQKKVFHFLLISAAAAGTEAFFSGQRNPIQKYFEHTQQRSASPPPEAAALQELQKMHVHLQCRGFTDSSRADLLHDKELGLEREELW